MKIPTRPREHGLRFNITPLIDVVFLLIIFFLAASHLVRSEVSQEVQLPEATQVDDEDKRPRHITIEIPANHELHIGGDPVDLAAIDHILLNAAKEGTRDIEIRIRSDRSVPFQVIEPILLTCARAGITDVKFAVLPQLGS